MKLAYNVTCTIINAVVSVVLIILCIIFAVVFRNYSYAEKCNSACTLKFVESIPVDVSLSQKGISSPTHEVFLDLIKSAEKKLLFLEFYFSLNNSAEEHAKGKYGLEVFEEILAAKKRGVHVEIIYDSEFYKQNGGDIEIFIENDIKVIPFNFTELFGVGCLHTKLILVDNESFYLGSSNMDWRSLSQVQEVGVSVSNCGCLYKDLEKIFGIYKTYESSKMVDYEYDTKINRENPIEVMINEEETNVYFSASPPQLNSNSRTGDLQGYFDILETAEEYVLMSVMTMKPFHGDSEYWEEFDKKLKSLLFKNVSVYILLSNWTYTSEMQRVYQRSLSEFGKVCEYQKIQYPDTKCTGEIIVKQMTIPRMKDGVFYEYTRVNHAKYVVSDKKFLVGTSNWEKGYFYNNAGISMIVNGKTKMKDLLEKLFWRNWNSKYTTDV